MYCSKCGALIAASAAFCSNCGQAFPVAVAVPRPPSTSVAVAVPVAGGIPAIPAYAVSGSVPRVEYAGFWLRLVALVIDNVILGFGFVLIVIPLIFLTGFRRFFDQFHPDEALNDAGIFMLIVFFFLAATGALLFTWLYHALMECSEWQATVGKKALGMVVTDLAGQRVSFGRATARHFGKIITNLVSFGIGLGYLMAAFTEKKQALHDMLAGCLVLRRND
ncbi:MAG TPA: RDD family protein [Candidatus Acidoferrum sp.]|nr:RDD family protein [Candidatus Acidoferrum sp.]